MRETLCGFVEDMYDRMEFGKPVSRRELMAAAEKLAGVPDVPKTRAESIYRFMRKTDITLANANQPPEESRQLTALIHAERREDRTIGYMRALDKDLGACVSLVRKDRSLVRDISAATQSAISCALHCLRSDNLCICDGPRGPGETGLPGEMEALHAENAAALDAFGTDDHLPEMLSGETRSNIHFVAQMVNANSLLVKLDADGLLRG